MNIFKKPENVQLSTIEKINTYTDSIYASKYESMDSLNYIRELNEVFIFKFHHAFAQYTFVDNFILYLFSKLTDDKHRGVVIPSDIASFDNGICSQQAILFIEMAKLRGFRARPVRGNRHFVSEVYVQGSWHIIDTDLKLSLIDTESWPSAQELSSNSQLLKTFYLDKIQYNNKALAATFFNKIEPGSEQEFAAKNLKLFHELTFFLSDYLWAICWAIVLFLNRHKIKSALKGQHNKTQKLVDYEL
jgi:hypothetical protein